MQQHERQTCARRHHNAETLGDTASEVLVARDLVRAGGLAAGEEPELEDEHADTADQEPSLGAPENHHDQRLWAPAHASILRKTNMRRVLIALGLIPLLIAMDLALWIAAPERRLTRSAVLAGIVAGRVAAGVAW